MNIQIVSISDTHNQHQTFKLPKCDIIVHAGDATMNGSEAETRNFLNWFEKQDSKYKIYVEGNHDFYGENNFNLLKLMCDERGITLLNDSGVELEGIKFWGSPVTPWFHDWAYNRGRGPEIMKHWNLIPTDTQFLITHGPPYQMLDYSFRCGNVGCQDLFYKVMEIKPLVHVFGHIHYSHGQTSLDGTTFINTSICDEQYNPTHTAFNISIEDGKILNIEDIVIV